jgi:hypothetical protein
MKTRFDIINELIKKNGYESYCEIGTQQSVSGSQVNCDFKVGVDPAPIKRESNDYELFYNLTSDDFFKQNTLFFDLVFIDGDHSYQQVKKDFINAVEFLRPGGVIVLHDCLPHCEEYTSLLWNGTVYQLVNDIVEAKVKNYEIINNDQGCGIVYKPTVKQMEKLKELDSSNLDYNQYVNNKSKWNIN